MKVSEVDYLRNIYTDEIDEVRSNQKDCDESIVSILRDMEEFEIIQKRANIIKIALIVGNLAFAACFYILFIMNKMLALSFVSFIFMQVCSVAGQLNLINFSNLTVWRANFNDTRESAQIYIRDEFGRKRYEILSVKIREERRNIGRGTQYFAGDFEIERPQEEDFLRRGIFEFRTEALSQAGKKAVSNIYILCAVYGLASLLIGSQIINTESGSLSGVTFIFLQAIVCDIVLRFAIRKFRIAAKNRYYEEISCTPVKNGKGNVILRAELESKMKIMANFVFEDTIEMKTPVGISIGDDLSFKKGDETVKFPDSKELNSKQL